MLYLQIASPKSSVLNFLDSNSFEVIISIFQRTEKVPDMERLRKKQEYQNNIDRIEVERTLSLSKRCYGMSCITTKLEEMQLTSIA